MSEIISVLRTEVQSNSDLQDGPRLKDLHKKSDWLWSLWSSQSESHPQRSQAVGQLLCLGLLGSQVHRWVCRNAMQCPYFSNALVTCVIRLLYCYTHIQCIRVFHYCWFLSESSWVSLEPSCNYSYTWRSAGWSWFIKSNICHLHAICQPCPLPGCQLVWTVSKQLANDHPFEILDVVEILAKLHRSCPAASTPRLPKKKPVWKIFKNVNMNWQFSKTIGTNWCSGSNTPYLRSSFRCTGPTFLSDPCPNSKTWGISSHLSLSLFLPPSPLSKSSAKDLGVSFQSIWVCGSSTNWGSKLVLDTPKDNDGSKFWILGRKEIMK